MTHARVSATLAALAAGASAQPLLVQPQVVQAWLPDPAAAHGWAGSDGVQAEVP